ncbi:ribonuclease HII [Curvivirga aplysinae]|uniref:ribonuclease HII n=1 Tax=Curvivirga aplysinae TaxID=2529852 RepID=UPI0012BBDC45|nr:ribonuclease HII [Curvivirga aplysinae]MTI09234.1 ribonuclease HII [Curvivirga aplysinae]
MPDFSLEQAFQKEGYQLVAGVDEVGRGPWAGPVVTCAVIIDQETFPKELFDQLDDSKKLSEKKREALYVQLQEHVIFAYGEASVDEIDELNILQATFLAMRRAVQGLSQQPDAVLVDGNKDPILGLPTQTVVKGDGKSLSISAASILAKVKRDHLMKSLAEDYPHYAWEKNAGYGTKAHQNGLAENGVTPHHRKSFKPIAALLET